MMRLRKAAAGFEVLGVDGDGAVVAAEAHAVGGLAADADGGVVAGVALADDGAFGVDEVAIDGDGAEVGGGVLDVGGEGADLGVGGVEAAGFDDAALPLCAVEVEGDERADVGDGLGGGEVLLGGGGLEALERGLLGGVGAQGVLVGLVGGGPEGVAEGHGVVVVGGELDGAVAAGCCCSR